MNRPATHLMNLRPGRVAGAVKSVLAILLVLNVGLATAAAQENHREKNRYSLDEIVARGNDYFGQATDGLARVVERAFARYGRPNGYILGEAASGALIGGLTYGQGTLYTKNAGNKKVFWQGPSVGFDYGGQGSRVMVLVYNLGSIDDVYGRFAGVSGQTYVIAGASMTVLQGSRIVLVPISTGVGARIGVNFGYLKLTRRRNWNPF